MHAPIRKIRACALGLAGALGLTVMFPTAHVSAGAADDPLRPQQWALDAVRADEAWQRGTGEGIVIAVVDSGVDPEHPDLRDKLVPGVDLVGDGNGTGDINGHGTHVAGIAAAAAGNGLGIAGCAPGARIMPVRVLDGSGAGTADTIADGVRWAAANGADVINLSLGEEGIMGRLTKGGPLNSAIRYASGQGAVVVAAAGNGTRTGQGTPLRNYRPGVPVIVVAAVDRSGVATSFTNYGDLRTVAAPGAEIISTVPEHATTLFPEPTGGYATMDGTSMATPIVACAAAILLGLGARADQVIEIIEETAAPAQNERVGTGVVDLAAATAAVAEGEGAAGDGAQAARGDGELSQGNPDVGSDTDAERTGVANWVWIVGSIAAGLAIGVVIGAVRRSGRSGDT